MNWTNRVHFLRKVLHILLMETEIEDLGVIFARFVPSLFLIKHMEEKKSAFTHVISEKQVCCASRCV